MQSATGSTSRGIGPRRSGGRLVVALVALAGLVAASGCGSGGSDSADPTTPGSVAPIAADLHEAGEAVDGGFLTIGIPTETDGWNPHRNRWAQSGALVGSSMLEPLAVLDENFDAQPWLATSWESNATFDEWTIELRDDVTFQNGEPFDAAAVKTNIDDAMTSALSGQAMRGVFDASSVTVEGPYTVKVKLLSPWSAFPTSYLAGQPSLMMAPAMLASEDGGIAEPIGTGPFEFAEWESGSHFEVVKNDDYWREGEPHLDRIEFRVISDQASQESALLARDVDMVITTDSDVAARLEGDHQIVKNWSTVPNQVMANNNPEVRGEFNPASNQHLRLALAHSTDRKAIAALIGEGVQTPTSPFAPDNPWGRPEDQNGYPDFDLDAAREEVERFKRETGQTEAAIVVTGSSDPQTVQILQALQSQWAEAGIDATLENLESPAVISQVVSGEYQFAIFGHLVSPEPDQNHYFWTSANAPGVGGVNINFSQYKSETVDAALATGRESDDPEVRQAAYDSIVDEYNEQALYIWLYWTPFTVVAADDVHGLNSLSGIPFANFQPKTFFGQLWMSEL
jgi:peptide/nickel transport system substrate-binding protein